MIRNPRENGSRPIASAVLPSTGRAPTPPLQGSNEQTTSSPFFPQPSSAMSRQESSPLVPIPVLGRTTLHKTNSAKKNGFKQNQSILSFFGKTEKKDVLNDSPSRDAGLFFEEVKKIEGTPTKPAMLFTTKHTSTTDVKEEDNIVRYNENITPVKRRRLSGHDQAGDLIRTPSPRRQSAGISVEAKSDDPFLSKLSHSRKVPKQRGGFVDDSSDEEDSTVENLPHHENKAIDSDRGDVNESGDGFSLFSEPNRFIETVETTKVPLKDADESQPKDFDDFSRPSVPPLTRQGTSAFAAGDFDDQEDFDDEFFPEGEEYLERQWMKEQRAMERAFDDDSKSESGADSIRTPRSDLDDDNLDEADEVVPTCPMCNGSMKGLSESDASTHVNACLDGNAKPLPQHGKASAEAGDSESKTVASMPSGQKRFHRAAIARPGQSNPFDTKDKTAKSAFSRLMSGHAEDAAWAEAATNEVQSRGKPAYQRTCPFYKIMPGLYICVDAFRYGKVEGQNAYFLSHFHSDHYIGLTSSWCHGPIYASKVTCNLMRQQLRVGSEWIVPLEFEKKVEVPNTNGVFVTMLPANHCPGSSLYLFEKVTGKNRDGSPKSTRILHCGDFRACPAHVNHPLLKPEVVDSISGQTKQQIIDTCYLDTTYLTPKYSFPSQYDVIDACAQMCISLSKEMVDTNDQWEKVKNERAGSVMTKFLEQGEATMIKKEDGAEAEEEDKKIKPRGRLLVVIGTYSIGKERICLGIARALNSKIYAPPPKMKICRALEDQELNSYLTSNPLEAQIHMQMLMEIRAETLHDYLVTFKPHFSRVVGFRPTGWSYRPPTSRFTENPAVQTVLHSEGWKSRFTMRDLSPQRGSTKESNCFGVPYSEHSSFRELTMFCCALRINRVVPTVNVGSAKSREKMKGWIEKWDADKRKNGLFKVEVGAEGWGSGDGKLRYGV